MVVVDKSDGVATFFSRLHQGVRTHPAAPSPAVFSFTTAHRHTHTPHTHTHTYPHLHTHTHTHTRPHAHTHTHTHTLSHPTTRTAGRPTQQQEGATTTATEGDAEGSLWADALGLVDASASANDAALQRAAAEQQMTTASQVCEREGECGSLFFLLCFVQRPVRISHPLFVLVFVRFVHKCTQAFPLPHPA